MTTPNIDEAAIRMMLDREMDLQSAFDGGTLAPFPSCCTNAREPKMRAILTVNEMLSAMLGAINRQNWHVTDAVDDDENCYQLATENTYICSPTFAMGLINMYRKPN